MDDKVLQAFQEGDIAYIRQCGLEVDEPVYKASVAWMLTIRSDSVYTTMQPPFASVRCLCAQCCLQDHKRPLHLATIYGHQQIAEFLLGVGADVNVVDQVWWYA